LQNRRSRWSLDGDTWLWQLSQQTTVLRSIFWPERAREAASPKSALIYLRTMIAFRTQLLLLMHLTRGQPARVIELLFVRHRNIATS